MIIALTRTTVLNDMLRLLGLRIAEHMGFHPSNVAGWWDDVDGTYIPKFNIRTEHGLISSEEIYDKCTDLYQSMGAMARKALSVLGEKRGEEEIKIWL